MGGEFAKLWTASAVSDIGDGVTLVAGGGHVAAVRACFPAPRA